MLAVVALLTNLFVAPASLFQNGYLEDVRGFNATTIAIFTIATATPAGIGLIVGGRVADVRGRKILIATVLPLATALGVVSYSVGGPAMWAATFLAGTLGGVTYPALAVYRTELFPTGNRGRAAGLLTATALIGGIGGLLVMGTLLDRDWSHGSVMGLLASGPARGHRRRPAVVPGDRPPGARGTEPAGRPHRPADDRHESGKRPWCLSSPARVGGRFGANGGAETQGDPHHGLRNRWRPHPHPRHPGDHLLRQAGLTRHRSGGRHGPGGTAPGAVARSGPERLDCPETDAGR